MTPTRKEKQLLEDKFMFMDVQSLVSSGVITHFESHGFNSEKREQECWGVFHCPEFKYPIKSWFWAEDSNSIFAFAGMEYL